MGVQAIGDRVFMLEMIGMLKKKKKEMQTTASLWSGETPAPGFGRRSFVFYIRFIQIIKQI